MKKLIIIVLLLSLQFTVFAQTDKEKVWNLVIQFENLLVTKDSAALDKFLVDDFVGTTPLGVSHTKREYIRFHCKPNVGLMSIKDEGIQNATIRTYGDVAVVNHRVAVQRKGNDGVVIDLFVQRIVVFVKEKGKWMVASGQGTQVVQR